MHLTVHNSILTDSSNDQYIGCHIKQTSIIRYLRTLRRMLGDTAYTLYRHNKLERDQGIFHITLISPLDYPLINKKKNIPLNLTFDIELSGIGKTQDAENICYYIIVQSDQLQNFRKKLDLGPAHFHITLGFNKNDVHNASKSKETIIKKVEGLPLK